MFQLENTPGRTCMVDGKEFLFFSGYSYLGMNYVKEFNDLIKEGIDKYGILFPSSRISNTKLNLYEAFENNLSGLLGMKDTVSFSSGFLAGKTVTEILSSYPGIHRDIFVAPGSHPAITIQNKLIDNALDFNEWKTAVTDFINNSEEDEFVIIADSVNTMRSEIHDFSFLTNIKQDKKIICLIDDSHGIGIIGKYGEGIVSHLTDKKNIDYILCYSLSKAFNINGGAISCSKYWAEKLRQHPNYSGSTAISPALMYAFINAKKLYELQRENLLDNISFLKNNLPSSLLRTEDNLPIFIYKDENLPAGQAGAEETFYQNAIIISSFRYPYSSSKKINRVIINALHTKDDLQKLQHVYS